MTAATRVQAEGPPRRALRPTPVRHQCRNPLEGPSHGDIGSSPFQNIPTMLACPWCLTPTATSATPALSTSPILPCSSRSPAWQRGETGFGRAPTQQDGLFATRAPALAPHLTNEREKNE